MPHPRNKKGKRRAEWADEGQDCVLVQIYLAPDQAVSLCSRKNVPVMSLNIWTSFADLLFGPAGSPFSDPSIHEKIWERWRLHGDLGEKMGPLPNTGKTGFSQKWDSMRGLSGVQPFFHLLSPGIILRAYLVQNTGLDTRAFSLWGLPMELTT